MSASKRGRAANPQRVLPLRGIRNCAALPVGFTPLGRTEPCAGLVTSRQTFACRPFPTPSQIGGTVLSRNLWPKIGRSIRRLKKFKALTAARVPREGAHKR